MPISHFRSLLFVPATSEHLWQKASGRGADAVVVDLEDAIPFNRKDIARSMAPNAIKLLKQEGAKVVLRVNSEAELWHQDLVGMPLENLSAIMLPKVETLDQVVNFANALESISPENTPPIAALIETPLGVLAAGSIATHPSLCALGFGAEDYSSFLGVSPQVVALAWPAQQVITCAHAYRLQCWGLAASIAEVNDMSAFEVNVSVARNMGFTGSVCIHPKQVAVVNKGFSPTSAELEWATRVISADQIAFEKGIGAVLLDGKMIDRPIVERARRLLSARH